MTKKHVLQHEYKPNFNVIAISSAQKDYRICWLLNRQLGFDLKRIADFCHVTQVGDPGHHHAVFTYDNAASLLHLNLIVNRSEECILFRQPKNIDFLLLFRNPIAHLDINELLKAIRSIPQVQAAFLLNPLSDKKNSEFFFDFELFLSQGSVSH